MLISNFKTFNLSLWSKIMLLMFFLFTLLGAAIYFSLSFIKEIQSDALVVNIAGQQRFLSERMANYVNRLHDEFSQNNTYALSDTIKRFEDNMVFLEGQFTRNRWMTNKEAIRTRDLISNQRQLWDSLRPDLEALVVSKPQDAPKKGQVFLAKHKLLFEISDEVTKAFQQEAEAHLRNLFLVMMVEMVFGLLVLLMGGIAIKCRIIQPLQRVKNVASRISLDGDHLPVVPEVQGQDEVAQIAREFTKIIKFLSIRAKLVNQLDSSIELSKSFHKLGCILQEDMGIEKMLLVSTGNNPTVISAYPEGALLPEITRAEPSKVVISPLSFGSEVVAYWFMKTTNDEAAKILKTHIVKPVEPHLVKLVCNNTYRERMAEAYLDAMKLLAAAVDAKDHYTAYHSTNVAHYAYHIAKRMGFSEQELSDIRNAALLHDIGKIGIPDNILKKPGRPTASERKEIEKHPILGANMLEKSILLSHLTPVVRQHHERVDGKGYPDGLREGQILLPAMILSVADSFDAMVTDRPYRKALSIDTAIEELRKCSGTQFNPEVVEVFIRWLEEEGLVTSNYAGANFESGLASPEQPIGQGLLAPLQR